MKLIPYSTVWTKLKSTNVFFYLLYDNISAAKVQKWQNTNVCFSVNQSVTKPSLMNIEYPKPKWSL